MSAVVLFQDACLTNPEIMSVLNTTRDTADNLDFAVLDDIAKNWRRGSSSAEMNRLIPMWCTGKENMQTVNRQLW